MSTEEELNKILTDNVSGPKSARNGSSEFEQQDPEKVQRVIDNMQAKKAAKKGYGFRKAQVRFR